MFFNFESVAVWLIGDTKNGRELWQSYLILGKKKWEEGVIESLKKVERKQRSK